MGGRDPKGACQPACLPIYLPAFDVSIHLSVYLPSIYLLACALTTACCCSGVIGSGSRSR